MMPCIATTLRCSQDKKAFTKAHNRTFQCQLPLAIRTETRFRMTFNTDPQNAKRRYLTRTVAKWPRQWQSLVARNLIDSPFIYIYQCIE
jgi:hypothetical protein